MTRNPIQQGESVVCVNARWDTSRFSEFDFPNGLPVEGKTYRVIGIVTRAGKRGLVLLGYPCIYLKGGYENGFYDWRFRRWSEITALALVGAEKQAK